MAFKLEGEVVIDGRKGTTALKDLQREANKTSDTFRKASGNTERLGKNLLSLGLNAGKAGTSLGSLARLGTGGLFGAAVLGSINKFGETVKQASTDYYQSQKALSDAFEMSFKSTSVEQAQAGLEKTEDTIESLRGKITQLGAFGGILKGIEKFTGINLGVGDTEKALESARANLTVLKSTVGARKKESDAAKVLAGELEALELANKMNAIDIKNQALKGDILDENASIAFNELQTVELQILAQKELLKTLESITGVKKNHEAIDKSLAYLADARVRKAQAEYNLAKANNDANAKRSKQAQEAGGGLLGASRAGQLALDNARKVRAREVKREDFRTQEQVFENMKKEENAKRKARGLGEPMVTAQNMRERVAAQQAAGEMPLLSEKLGAMQGTTPASQVAAEKAKEGGGADMQKSLLDAIKKLSEQIPAAVATG
jgi:hypothetical protein